MLARSAAPTAVAALALVAPTTANGFGTVQETATSVTISIQSTSPIDNDQNFFVTNNGGIWSVNLTIEEREGGVFSSDSLRIVGTIQHPAGDPISLGNGFDIEADQFNGQITIQHPGACVAHGPGAVDYMIASMTVANSNPFEITDYSATIVVTTAPSGVVYCTAKTNSLGCTPQIATPSGAPRVSSFGSFDVTATNVLNARNGLFFYGKTGRAAIPFLGATLCVAPPLARTAIQNSNGSPPPAMDCSGAYVFDVNALLDSGADPGLTIGTSIHGQFWSRDPADPTGAGLTDAVELVVCP